MHFPWCVRRCPYCDFNAHEQPSELPVRPWLNQISAEAAHFAETAYFTETKSQRQAQTLFLGGGTPSLLPAEAVAEMLEICRTHLSLSPTAEITMEANPGALELSSPEAFRRTGVSRLSLGVQSFNADSLRALGRIHSAADAEQAVGTALQSGFDSVNLDLMYGLPGQSPEMAARDLQQAIALRVQHISWYQLTIEPNTRFWSQPPALPPEEVIEEIETVGEELLRQAGFERYEISAWSQPGFACSHNINYWTFGDYLGLGPGAHSKMSSTESGIRRWANHRAPETWLAQAPELVMRRQLEADDLAFEFVLNAFRLLPEAGKSPCQGALLRQRTGLEVQQLQHILAPLRQQGLLHAEYLAPTDRGRRYLNDLTAAFLPETTAALAADRQRGRGLRIWSEREEA